MTANAKRLAVSSQESLDRDPNGEEGRDERDIRDKLGSLDQSSAFCFMYELH